LKNIPKRFLY